MPDREPWYSFGNATDIGCSAAFIILAVGVAVAIASWLIRAALTQQGGTWLT